MELKFCKTKLVVATVILALVHLCDGDICSKDPVQLDDKFLSCCKGRPKYTSETCIDALLANGTFSQECVVDCIYRNLEMYNGQVIDLTKVKNFVDAEIPDEEFRVVYMNAFESCSKYDKLSIKREFSAFNHKNNKYGCDKYPTLMEICVWYHSIANCPEKYVTDNEACNNKRDWVKECLL